MKSPLGLIKKETIWGRVCIMGAKRKRETEGVMLTVFFSITINNKPSPNAPTWPPLQHVCIIQGSLYKRTLWYDSLWGLLVMR